MHNFWDRMCVEPDLRQKYNVVLSISFMAKCVLSTIFVWQLSDNSVKMFLISTI